MPIIRFTRNVQALLPRYVTNYQCLGDRCEDNCCRGWLVNIDKPTYDAYRDSPDRKLRESVELNRENRTDQQYGHIALKHGVDCTLVENGLCSVHKNMGEDYLSHVCYTYPRQTNQVEGTYEQTLELSCVEAARQALLAPDAFDFVEGPITARAEMVREFVPAEGFAPELINEVRFFCLNLMRVRELPVWQRLAVLGLFCENADGLVRTNDNAALLNLIAEFTSMLEQGAIIDTLAAIQPDYEAQATIFSTLWAGLPFTTVSIRRNKIVAGIAAGLGADASGQVSGERLVESYRAGMRRLPEALANVPWMLEHYLLNEMMRNVFPFGESGTYQHFLQLVARFGLLRFMLAARCNTADPLPTETELAAVVEVHARRFHHEPAFIQKVNDALRNSAYGKLDKLYTLLPD
jgi:lysine-N-methylase